MGVVNEFIPKTGYYYCWGIEYEIRDRAKKWKNTFGLGIFACCREIHRTTTHTGLFGGSKEAALVHFTKITHAELEAEGDGASATKKAAKKVLNEEIKVKMD